MLKLQERNPRTISDEALTKLAESIQRDPEFMKLRPIVVDKDNMIVAGNQRYKALLKLGYEEPPEEWVVKAESLDPEKLRRFMLIDNAPPGLSGSWDWEILTQDFELDTLQDIGFEVQNVNFMPEINPNLVGKEYTAGDMENAEKKLNGKFQGYEQDQEMICPHCGETFFYE